MDSTIGTVNEFVEEYKDYPLGEIKPALDVLFHAYDYEKKQLEVMDTMSVEEYNNLVKAYKINKTMALRLKTGTSCCVCNNSLIQSLDNGSKDEVVLFGCGHAVHRSCMQSTKCPVAGCWEDLRVDESYTNRRASTSGLLSMSKPSVRGEAKEVEEQPTVEELIDKIESGELTGTTSTLSVVAPPPSAIFRRKWLLKAVNMSSCLEMDVDI